VSLVGKYLQFNVTLNLGQLGDGAKLNMTTAITMLALSAALFFLTNYLLSRKISLK
jgi:hypothetical protein